MSLDESSPSFSLETAPGRTSLSSDTPLLPSQGGDEFAAEVGDVRDHAAQDRVGIFFHDVGE
jgi:hypothetical protein